LKKGKRRKKAGKKSGEVRRKSQIKGREKKAIIFLRED